MIFELFLLLFLFFIEMLSFKNINSIYRFIFLIFLVIGFNFVSNESIYNYLNFIIMISISLLNIKLTRAR